MALEMEFRATEEAAPSSSWIVEDARSKMTSMHVKWGTSSLKRPNVISVASIFEKISPVLL